MRSVLTLKRPSRRVADILHRLPVSEDDLRETTLSSKRINRALKALCREAHKHEGGGEQNLFHMLYVADQIYGERHEARPKLSKYLHIRRLLVDRHWSVVSVRAVVAYWDRVLLAATKKQGPVRGPVRGVSGHRANVQVGGRVRYPSDPWEYKGRESG